LGSGQSRRQVVSFSPAQFVTCDDVSSGLKLGPFTLGDRGIPGPLEIQPHQCSRREDDAPFDHVLKFANISGPVVGTQQTRLGRSDEWDRPVESSRGVFSKQLGQRRNLLPALSQRRKLEMEQTQLSKQLPIELSRCSVGSEIPVGRGDQPAVSTGKAGVDLSNPVAKRRLTCPAQRFESDQE
jgi:hypothetical protein